MKKLLEPFSHSLPNAKFFSHPSQSFIIKAPTNLDLIISEEDLNETVSIFENKSQRESLSNIENVETFIVPYHSNNNTNK